MVGKKLIYVGLKYLNNLNIIYKSFNIDIYQLPDVSFRITGKNLGTIIPDQGKFQNRTEKCRFPSLQDLYSIYIKKFDSMPT